MIVPVLLTIILLTRGFHASVVPSYPGPGLVFKQGSQCEIQWTPDPTGQWNKMSIDLMTGSNDAMTVVTNVVRGLDGSDPTLSPYTWTCPDVDPYSSIYFYQFTRDKNAAKNDAAEGLVNETDGPDMPAWTTRFTIASANGTTVAPQHTAQSGGEPVPWGVGKLRNVQAVVNGSTVRTSISIDSNSEAADESGSSRKDDDDMVSSSLTEELDPPSQSVIVAIPAPPSYVQNESSISSGSMTAASSTVTAPVINASGSGASINPTSTNSKFQFQNGNINAAWRRPMLDLTSDFGITVGFSVSSLVITWFCL
ncbi:hypothetical protein FRC02_006223 [Tulasnella sp. 418]|nr:hypothetical protein FRC02_006223 [Tulasnella sp. 418]